MDNTTCIGSTINNFSLLSPIAMPFMIVEFLKITGILRPIGGLARGRHGAPELPGEKLAGHLRGHMAVFVLTKAIRRIP